MGRLLHQLCYPRDKEFLCEVFLPGSNAHQLSHLAVGPSRIESFYVCNFQPRQLGMETSHISITALVRRLFPGEESLNIRKNLQEKYFNLFRKNNTRKRATHQDHHPPPPPEAQF